MSVQDPLSPGQAAREPVWTHSVLLAAFALCALLAVGYGFGSADSANYIPLVWARLDPGLFAGDTVFGWILASSWSYHASFFTSLMAMLSSLTSVEWAFFLLHLVSLVTLFGAWWLVGRAIGGTPTAYLTLLLLAIAHPVGGTQIPSIPHEFQPRILANALAFLAIASLVSGQRHRLAAALAGAAMLLHPISALMALPVVIISPWISKSPWAARLRTWAASAALVVVPFVLWQYLHAGEAVTDTALTGTVSQAWQNIIDFRLQGQAVNVSSWTSTHWLLVGVPLLFWIAALGRRSSLTETDRILGVALMASLTLAVGGSIAADVFRSTMASQLMLSRLVYVPVVLGAAYCAWWLLAQWQDSHVLSRIWVLLAGSAFALGEMAMVLLALLPVVLLQRTRDDLWLDRAAQVLSLCCLAILLAVTAHERWLPHPTTAAAPRYLLFEPSPPSHLLRLTALAGSALLASQAYARWRTVMLAGAVAVSPLVGNLVTHRVFDASGAGDVLVLTIVAATGLLASLSYKLSLTALLAGVVAVTAVGVYVAPHRHLSMEQAVTAVGRRLQVPWKSDNSAGAQVAYWARGNTPNDSRFLLPVTFEGFRAMAKRGIVTDWKDGGLTLFSESLAQRWLGLYREVAGLETRSPRELVMLARKHHCNYVVFPSDRPIGWNPVYTAGPLAVYAVADAPR